MTPDPQNLAGGAWIVAGFSQASSIAQGRFVLAPANQTSGDGCGRQRQALAPDAGEDGSARTKASSPLSATPAPKAASVALAGAFLTLAQAGTGRS
ncbi:MAG: hypothetical protein ACREFM_24890, partial [Hypericibacter sp.]